MKKKLIHKFPMDTTEKTRLTAFKVLCGNYIDFVFATGNWREVNCKKCRKIKSSKKLT